MLPPLTRRAAACLVAAALAMAGCSGGPDAGPAEQPATTAPTSPPSEPAEPGETGAAPGQVRPLPQYTRSAGVVTDEDLYATDDPIGRWQEETAVQDVRITSTADGSEQPALWAPPPGPGQPLLVAVHSWSTAYEQEETIPLAQWAAQAGWGYVQPDFRGVNDDPDATGSDLAVQDVVDAVDYAVAQGGVDPERVYVIGFSGGGMMSLLLAGRNADRFAGAVSWVPIYDLSAWYAYNRDEQPQRAYAEQIVDSCGGDPTEDAAALSSCAARSPAGVLPAAAEAGVPVYIGAGIDDDIVPPSDAVQSFNALAEEGDRLPAGAVQAFGDGEVPPDLQGMVGADTWFTEQDPRVLFARTSAAVTLVIFDGGHNLIYYPGLDWLARLDASPR